MDLQFECLAEVLGLGDLPLDVLVPELVRAPLAPARVHRTLVLRAHVLLVVRVLRVHVVLQIHNQKLLKWSPICLETGLGRLKHSQRQREDGSTKPS